MFNHIASIPKQNITAWLEWARRISLPVSAAALLLFLALYNLPVYPRTWFDEGSYLHVPKTLVRNGVYADASSEGFRYSGPVLGLGPTVILPMAASFKLFGVGLVQARLVSVVYLMGALVAFYYLAHRLGGSAFAWIATGLFATSRGISLFEYGRQALGEVPGLFFLLAGLLLWFSSWEKESPGLLPAKGNYLNKAGSISLMALLGTGMLFGLALITKPQYLIVTLPALGLAWLLNLGYYRLLPWRAFILPAGIALAVYLAWQVIQVAFLGPATMLENFATLRNTVSGAALSFSPDLMMRAVRELFRPKVFLSLLFPALVYGLVLALPRRLSSLRWAVLLSMIAANLTWYSFASISWLRYAFPGLALSSFFVARFFEDLTGGFKIQFDKARIGIRSGRPEIFRLPLQVAALGWLGFMVLFPLGQNLASLLRPPVDDTTTMAEYLNIHVPVGLEVETWEPEMGIFTDHNYHYPPNELLDVAVRHIWLDGPPLGSSYEYLSTHNPPYVLVGEFARWVDLYSQSYLLNHYELIQTIGRFDLYRSRERSIP